MKTLRIIVAFFQSSLSFLGFCFVAIGIYAQVKFPFNIIGAFLTVLVGFYFSRMTFNMMRRRGVVETMTGNNATYDLDEIEPTAGDGVSKLTPLELVNLFLEKKVTYTTGVTISIWGDWEGRQLNVKHHLDSIEFNLETNLLTINFSDNCLLIIKRPSLILCSSSYLKIVNAKEILWQTPQESSEKNQYSYLNTGKEIKTKSNTKWKPHSYDIGIGMNAIYLQG